MKITASFNSPDSADFAAGALKRALSPLASVETKNINMKQYKDNMNIFTAFNTMSATTPTYSMPVVYNPAFYENANNRERNHFGIDYILEVVCRKDEESAASKIIISYGGRNISKLQ